MSLLEDCLAQKWISCPFWILEVFFLSFEKIIKSSCDCTAGCRAVWAVLWACCSSIKDFLKLLFFSAVFCFCLCKLCHLDLIIIHPAWIKNAWGISIKDFFIQICWAGRFSKIHIFIILPYLYVKYVRLESHSARTFFKTGYWCAAFHIAYVAQNSFSQSLAIKSNLLLPSWFCSFKGLSKKALMRPIYQLCRGFPSPHWTWT